MVILLLFNDGFTEYFRLKASSKNVRYFETYAHIPNIGVSIRTI